MTGRTISHYEVREKLGEGGMGVVYKGVDTLLHRSVALKFLPPELTRDDEAKTRFVHEARAASALDHPNICTIHEIGETDDGQLFIAMAYYAGETLKAKIARGPLPEEEAIEYACQIAAGLERAHEAGIIHRDIKPANVVVTERGDVKILDFGLAKIHSVNLTKTGKTPGTAAYMSPEQVRGEQVDHRSDVWSLGVVLYEMLSGRRPFEAEYEQALLFAILNADTAPLTSTRPELAALVERCLRKDRGERHQQVAEIRAELERFWSRQAAALPQTQRRLLRRRSFWVSAASSALIVMLAAMWLTYPSESIAFAERDWILITDFENETHEELFDESLNAALAVSIGQSRYVNVFPEQRTIEVLRRMRQDPTVRVDARVGLEIARREGLRALLVPGISRVGGTYALTARIRDVQTGEDLRAQIVQARGKDEVLDALDELSAKIRRDLGEAVPAIRRRSEPLVKITTASLDALRQYALGKERLIQADFEQARFHFERALDLDTSFTAARASLGILHVERSNDPWAEGFDSELGRALLVQSVEQVDELTEAEKFSVLAFHAAAVKGRTDEAALYYQALLDLYPDRLAAHNNLGRMFEAMNRYDQAAASYKEALRLNADATLTRNGLIMLYLFKMGRLDSALVWSKQQVRLNPEHAFAHSLLGYTYLGLDSLEAAQASIERALELNRESGRDLFRLARIHWLRGRLNEAIQALERIRAFNPDSWADYWLYLLYARQGDTVRANAQLEAFRRIADQWVEDYPEMGMSYIARGLVLTHSGRAEQGWEQAQRALEVDMRPAIRDSAAAQEDQGHRAKVDPEIYLGLARVAVVQGRHADALEALEEGFRNGFTDYVWMKIHPDLEPLYDHPAFRRMLAARLKR